MRPPVLTSEVRKRVVALRSAGYSYSYIAHHVGIFNDQVYHILKDAGLIRSGIQTLYRKPAGGEFKDAESMTG